MSTQGIGRRRSVGKAVSAEEQALDLIAKEAESRLAARRQARVEAREIRMRELERQQRETEENGEKNFDSLQNETIRPNRTPVVSTPKDVTPIISRAASHASSYVNSRRSSEDSTEYDLDKARELRHQLTDLEDKFRKAMINNAQLDNEKASLRHQVDLMKDEAEDMEERYALLQREHRETYRLHELLKREFEKLRSELMTMKEALIQRDELINEYGLVLVGCENDIPAEDSDSLSNTSSKVTQRPMLISQEAAQMLGSAGEGSLDNRLKMFAEEKQELIDEVTRLKLELDEEKKESRLGNDGLLNNGPEMELVEAQREAVKQIGDYKFKMKKAEQEISTMQGLITRLENQVSRYKSAAESAEKVEDELRIEKRKTIRELREAQSRVEELETSNNHLQKRIDKLKSARNALIKS